MNNIFEQENWSKKKKFSFYFLFLYIILYAFPFPIDFLLSIFARFLTWIQELSGWSFLSSINKNIELPLIYLENFWQWLAINFGNTILSIKEPISTFPNGSGDTTYAYILVLVKLLIVIAGSSLWLFFSKKSNNYIKLYYLLLTLTRYYIAYVMLSYGFYKIIQSQFPYPSLLRLIQPYGDSSPMGLAWTFMGYSENYNLFTGSCEIIGALLLLFRRTKMFGALFTMSVCTTIFVMNLCFDIPVKLFSLHLLLFTAFIATDDIKRIIAFFFTNQPTMPHITPFYFANHKKKKLLNIFKGLTIVYLIYTGYVDTKKAYSEYGAGAPKPPLYGIYNAKFKSINKDTIPLLYGDTIHWKQIVIVDSGLARIKTLNDSVKKYVFEVDTLKSKIKFYKINDTITQYNFSFKYKKPALTLTGKIKKDSIKMEFSQFDESKMLLNSRGFHWINEYPYNK